MWNILSMVLPGYAAMIAVMLILFAIQRRSGDAGIVDVGWAAGVGALAILFACLGTGDLYRRILLALMAGIWSFRLAIYLLLNRVIAPGEDGRYQMLREKWGSKAQRNLFLFFQAQAFWAVLFALPLVPAAFNPRGTPSAFDVAAAVVWVVSVGGEAIADWQLARFRGRPENKGKTCKVGLWRYSRHPNYFFEWIHWWTYVLLAIGSPFFWVSLAGPAVMLLFLYKLTGIPYTEKRALLTRGDEYRSYQRTTSAFIPWPPKDEEV